MKFSPESYMERELWLEMPTTAAEHEAALLATSRSDRGSRLLRQIERIQSSNDDGHGALLRRCLSHAQPRSCVAFSHDVSQHSTDKDPS